MLLLIPVTSGIVEGQQSRRHPPVRKPTTVVPKVRFASGKSALKIPFELFGNLVLLQVRVNDSASLRFILDTGADRSAIDAQQTQTLRLKPQGKIVGSGGGAQRKLLLPKALL